MRTALAPHRSAHAKIFGGKKINSNEHKFGERRGGNSVGSEEANRLGWRLHQHFDGSANTRRWECQARGAVQGCSARHLQPGDFESTDSEAWECTLLDAFAYGKLQVSTIFWTMADCILHERAIISQFVKKP